MYKIDKDVIEIIESLDFCRIDLIELKLLKSYTVSWLLYRIDLIEVIEIIHSILTFVENCY